MRRLKKDALAKRIDETGMTPFAFAKKNGITPESLRRWLNGQRDPKIDNIIQLAAALHCDVSDISEWISTDDASDTEDRIGWVTSLSDEEYAEIVNAYTSGTLDPFQIAKIDDIENFRDRAILGVSKLAIPAEIKGTVIAFLSQLEQLPGEK